MERGHRDTLGPNSVDNGVVMCEGMESLRVRGEEKRPYANQAAMYDSGMAMIPLQSLQAAYQVHERIHGEQVRPSRVDRRYPDGA